MTVIKLKQTSLTCLTGFDLSESFSFGLGTNAHIIYSATKRPPKDDRSIKSQANIKMIHFMHKF